MKKIVFITTPDAEYGFSLSGVTQYASDAAESEEIIGKTTADPDTGLIIIDERLAMGMTEERLRELEKNWHEGVFLVLPSPVKPPEEVEDYAARLIRRAIGYHVRVKV
jgi:V/A-type H+-transporting ATPase subunit F